MSTLKERIEKDADNYLNNLEYRSAISESEIKSFKLMYVAGAMAEHPVVIRLTDGKEFIRKDIAEQDCLKYTSELREALEDVLLLAAKSPSMSSEEFLKIVDRAKAILDKH